MGSIGATELVLIVLAIVFLFGAKKIPEIAAGLGKGIREFKKAAREIDEDPPAEQKKLDDKSAN